MSAIFFPLGLHGLALLAALIVVWMVGKWRTNYGRSRGLPPGSLSLVTSVEALIDRRFYLKHAQRHGPVFKVSQFSSPVICVVGLQRGQKLLRDHPNSIGPAVQPFTRQISAGFLRYMDQDTYRTYNSLFRKALSGSVVDSAAGVTKAAASQAFQKMANDCVQSPGSAVRPGEYLNRIVYDSFVRALFGFGPGTDEYEQFAALYRGLSAWKLAKRLDKGSLTAVDALHHFLLEQAARLQESANDGTQSDCALRAMSLLDSRMPDSTCVHNLLFILRISTRDVVGLLHWILLKLGENPYWIDRVRREIAALKQNENNDLIDRIIKETLRLGQSEYLYRRMLADVEFEGFRFPKDWKVRVCVWESHRDPKIFADAELFDPDRFLQNDIAASQFSPFGFTQHACNGVGLTFMICQHVIAALAKDFDWEIASNGPLERDFRHWHHWRPSSNFRLRLEPRRKSHSSRVARTA